MKLKVHYTPDDAEPQVWDFDVGRLMVVELEAIEKVTGLSYIEFAEGLDKARGAAYRALVWVMRKSHGEPDLRYSAVDFPIGALRFERIDDVDQELAQLTDTEDGDEEVPKEAAPQNGASGS